MSLAEVLTFGALVFNLFALLFAGFQTYQSRKALGAARESIDLTRKSRYLEYLPEAGWITQVSVSLERWQRDLQSAAELLTRAIKEKDGEILRHMAANTLESPAGLVPQFVYEHAPDWLRELLMAGARHYYDAVAAFIYLWRKEEDSGNFSLAEMLLERCEESVKHLDGLVQYLNDLLPESYLSASASLKDEDYLS